MTAVEQLRQTDSRLQELPGRIPLPETWRCARCCGPKDPAYSECSGCRAIFWSAPEVLANSVVPITAALEIGPWYGMLKAYKQTDRAAWPFLATIVGAFVETHADRLRDQLGGPADGICVVPSKRGVDRMQQPLFRVAELATGLADIPTAEAILRHANMPVPRRSYVPSAFQIADGQSADGRRLILIEDSWTSGATAISAAGALLAAGANSVVVMPLARLINVVFWGDQHPYVLATKQTWRVETWPHDPF